MEITYLGYSCFRLRSRETTLITDPFPPELGYSLGRPSAQIVTVSHAHPGHSYTKGVGDSPRIVSRPGEYEIAGVFIQGVASFHDGEQGKKRGKNTVFVIQVEGMKLGHLGDIGHLPTGELSAALKGVEVLFLPVGGSTTIDARQAAQLARQLQPRIVIPMHYRTPVYGDELAEVAAFLKEIGLQAEPRPKLSVTSSSLPPALQVILLDYNR